MDVDGGAKVGEGRGVFVYVCGQSKKAFIFNGYVIWYTFGGCRAEFTVWHEMEDLYYVMYEKVS